MKINSRIEDRKFCTLGLLFGMARRGAAFVVRQHGQLPGELLGRLTRKGVSRSGLVYEQPMLVRDPESGETMRLRRITVKLTEPTRNGDTTLHILSNVPIPRASAAHLARLYGKRWSIETAFFEIVSDHGGTKGAHTSLKWGGKPSVRTSQWECQSSPLIGSPRRPA